MKNSILCLAFIFMLCYNVNADFKSLVQVSKPTKLNYSDIHKVISNINKIKPKFIFPLHIKPNDVNTINIKGSMV
jgi:hypothetical protein